jgi:hypothetical protein
VTDATAASSPVMADPAALVDAGVQSVREHTGCHPNQVRALPAVQEIITAPGGVRRVCIIIAARLDNHAGRELLRYIARKSAGLTLEEIEAILPPPVSDVYHPGWDAEVLVSQIEATWKSLDDAGRARLLPQLERVAAETLSATAATRLRKLTTAVGSDPVPYDLIDDTRDVGKALRAVLAAVQEPNEAKARLIGLLADYPLTGVPAAKWRKEAPLVRDMLHQPAETVGSLLNAALDAPDYQHKWGTSYCTERDEAFLCGITVFASQVADVGLLPRLRRLALKAITMIGGESGHPRSIRLANHCVQAIADADLPSSVSELLRAERGTRHGSLLRKVRTSIDALATARGLTRDELLEMAVEDYGLSRDGTRRVGLPEAWVAVIEADARTARLGYEDPGGKPRKSLPPAIRQASADTRAAITKDLKAIRATIGHERARLDACLSAGRSWQVPRWRDLCLDHPVTGRLARALIWTFSDQPGTVTGIPVSAKTLVTADSTEVPMPVGEATEVRLWHPVHATADEVRAWRQLLIGMQLVQPLKQAFREVYVLTPAEEATRVYSNRFAGHIFLQEQARALMKGRSWTPAPLGEWAHGAVVQGIASREYPPASGQALRAEFFFDPVGDNTTHGGLYQYCTSDQVRFLDASTGEAVPLAEVNLLTFSETMRDVDLFIGVTSIGADPEWLDRGEERRFGDYWHRYAFGDLGAGAEIRREILAGLVPMLAIADRCEFQDRFLVVRGDLRTYRIHLGSGNILMSPNDQYLCIVAARDARASRLFLPFDDDPALSLILSKAFLLADDTKITDQTIIRQIKAG